MCFARTEEGAPVPHLFRVVLSFLLLLSFTTGCAIGDMTSQTEKPTRPPVAIGNHGPSDPSPILSSTQPANPGKGTSSHGGSSTPANHDPSAPNPSAPATPEPFQYPTLTLNQAGPSVLRLQQLLSASGYLPLTWSDSESSKADLSSTESIANPPSGTFTWRYSNTPASLKSLWKPGTYTVMVRGAVMAYQEVNHLSVDGIVGPKVWASLLNEITPPTPNPYGYAYVQVVLKKPQTLTLWWNGKTVLTTRVNSGIPQSPTVTGTYPVYVRYRTQRMSGVTPWGEHYDDPDVPYVSYFYKGEAVHGFPRNQYGYPQSLGCVELPISQAAIAWKYMHYGTLVHIT